MLREFPLVIATVAKVSRMRGLWLVVHVNKGAARSSDPMTGRLPYLYTILRLISLHQ